VILRELVQLTKPRISVLSVATAAVGMALAGKVSGGLAATTLVGTLLLVGAANTLNMYVERDVDAKMARTRRRPLPAGRLSPGIALGFGLAQAAVAIPLLWLGANLLTGALGALALVLYVLVYTPLKRVTTHALLVGAIPGAMPPLLGYTAVSGTVTVACLGVFAAMFLWQVPHFLAIALFQKDDYRAAGLKVLPVEKGEDAARRSIVVYLALQVAVTLLLVPLGLGGVGYFLGALALGGAMLGWGLWAMRTRADARWARQFFLGTITYLPVWFLLLLVA